MSVTISVELRALQDLAEELAALAAELAGEAELCRSATYTLTTAVDGETAAAAGRLGDGWAGLLELLAQGTGGFARALGAAVLGYMIEDLGLAEWMHR